MLFCYLALYYLFKILSCNRKLFVFTFCKIPLHLHKENSFTAKSKKNCAGDNGVTFVKNIFLSIARHKVTWRPTIARQKFKF